MAELRRSPRLNVGSEVWLGQDGIFSRTNERLSNISIGGLFIETAQSFAKGSVVSVRFKIGDGAAFISCSVIVRNSRPGVGMGVEFLDLPPEARTRLDRLMASEVTRSATAGD